MTDKKVLTTNKGRIIETIPGGGVVLYHDEHIIKEELFSSENSLPPDVGPAFKKEFLNEINEINEINFSEKKPFKRTDKVAIVGFAPSSMHLAPFLDDSWEIWTLNNIYTAFDLPRWDRWFELHPNFREYAPFQDVRMDATSIVRGDSRPATRKLDHLEWLKAQTPDKPIYFLKDEPDIPAAVRYPIEAIKEWCAKEEFATYFSNSISYMIALALMDGYKTVGVWGVDMAAGGEYSLERPSVEYWLAAVKACGAKLVLPKETELLKARLYGYEQDSDFVTKAKVRHQELMNNHNRAMQQVADAQAAAHYFRGAAEDAQYFITNWGNGS